MKNLLKILKLKKIHREIDKVYPFWGTAGIAFGRIKNNAAKMVLFGEITMEDYEAIKNHIDEKSETIFTSSKVRK